MFILPANAQRAFGKSWAVFYTAKPAKTKRWHPNCFAQSIGRKHEPGFKIHFTLSTKRWYNSPFQSHSYLFGMSSGTDISVDNLFRRWILSCIWLAAKTSCDSLTISLDSSHAKTDLAHDCTANILWEETKVLSPKSNIFLEVGAEGMLIHWTENPNRFFKFQTISVI